MYQAMARDELLSQGDIVDACPVFRLHTATGTVDLKANPRGWDARVIVLTQACDLAHGKTSKVLVAVIQPAERFVHEGILKASVVRDQIRRSLAYGWYFLPAAPAPIALAESIADLREVHTVPIAVLEQLIADGKRLCRLVTPYREHLAQHFAVTYMRIGLPAPYDTEP